ncbi:hypothetical protein [Halobacteriovorax sp.]|uniref:hypothetical protein n=1 Tax=Halobacteriovorax sp. TaxID=2020862 RepID=UPI0035674563
MKNLKIALFLSLISFSALGIECTGESRETNGREVTVIKESLVDQGYDYVTKLELDIKSYYFSAQVDGDDVLAIISLGPDYTSGNLSKSSFNSEGRLKLSYVTPTTTLILECTK